MREQEVDMYIMQNRENFPQEQLPYLRNRLLAMTENQFAGVTMVQLKSPTTMLIISIFLGGYGIDRFMLGQTGAGVGKLLTAGGCGIWAIIDWFNIQRMTRDYNWEKMMMVLQ